MWYTESQIIFVYWFCTWSFTEFIFLKNLFRATPMAYGSYQARGQFGATATPDLSWVWDLHHSSQQCQSLNPLSEARDEPMSSWILVGFITAEPGQEFPIFFFFFTSDSFLVVWCEYLEFRNPIISIDYSTQDIMSPIAVFLCCPSFFFFFSHPHGICKFLGQGLNPNWGCDVCHSLSNVGSLTYRARPEDWTGTFTEISGLLIHWATARTPHGVS